MLRSIGTLAAFALVAGFVTGCGGGGERLVTVTGKVYNGDKLLDTGGVLFHPDATKGTKTKSTAVGQIGADGTYTLSTTGKAGAPLGWFKVTVTADAKPSEKDKYALPTSLINTKYRDLKSTTILIEVVESPKADAYDIKLAK